MGAWPGAGPGVTSPGVWGQHSPAFGKRASISRGAARSPGVGTPAPRISAHETSRGRRLRSRRLPPAEAAGSGRAGREAGCLPSGSPPSPAPRRALQAAAPSSPRARQPALRRSRFLCLYAFLYSPTVFLTFIFSFTSAAQAHSPVEKVGNVWVAPARDPAGSPAVWAEAGSAPPPGEPAPAAGSRCERPARHAGTLGRHTRVQSWVNAGAHAGVRARSRSRGDLPPRGPHGRAPPALPRGSRLAWPCPRPPAPGSREARPPGSATPARLGPDRAGVGPRLGAPVGRPRVRRSAGLGPRCPADPCSPRSGSGGSSPARPRGAPARSLPPRGLGRRFGGAAPNDRGKAGRGERVVGGPLGRGARPSTRRPGPLRRKKLFGGMVGGCPSFGELFHLKFYNPAVPPTESGSRGGQAPPTTPDCQRRRGPGGLELWLLLPPPAPRLFFGYIFFSESEKKKKKKRARAAACSGACSASRGSRLQLFLSRPNSARASNFASAGAQICLPLNSTLMCAPRPLAAVCSRGDHASEAQACQLVCFPEPGPSLGRGERAPREHPGRGRSAPAPWGRGAGSSRARNVAS